VTDPDKKNSLHLISGLILGAAVAAGANFLYKTKTGRKIKKDLEINFQAAKKHLPELVKQIKTQAEKIEAELKNSTLSSAKKTKKIKRRLQQTAAIVKKKVFLKSGKPLAN